MRIRENPLRNIARAQLAELFSQLAPETREALEISLVRQWLTYDGYAGLITPLHDVWFKLVRREDGYEVGMDSCDSGVPALLQDCGVAEDEVPELFHRANLSQNANFVSGDGKWWHLSIDPRARRVTLRPAAPDDV